MTTLGEGMTPLLPLPTYGAVVGVPRLLMKDEGLVPTGSFKARGAAVGVSRARELGVEAIAMPTNGNAGAAWSVYAARAGLGSLIVMPVDAPEITRRECVVAGAELYLVDGLINHAGALVKEAVQQRPGYQEVSTLKEPYRIEGKKTMGYEIAEQLGWRVPDVILYPAGGGVGLIGIHKAMLEMRELGWIGDRLPRLVAVQSTGCSADRGRVRRRARREHAGGGHAHARVRHQRAQGARRLPGAARRSASPGARRSRSPTTTSWPRSPRWRRARAPGSAPRARPAWRPPGGCATAAGSRQDDEVVVLNTGTGLKYPDTVRVDVPVLARDGVVPAR